MTATPDCDDTYIPQPFVTADGNPQSKAQATSSQPAMALPAGAAAPAGAKSWIQALKDEYSLDDATVAHLVDP